MRDKLFICQKKSSASTNYTTCSHNRISFFILIGINALNALLMRGKCEIIQPLINADNDSFLVALAARHALVFPVWFSRHVVVDLSIVIAIANKWQMNVVISPVTFESFCRCRCMKIQFCNCNCHAYLKWRSSLGNWFREINDWNPQPRRLLSKDEYFVCFIGFDVQWMLKSVYEICIPININGRCSKVIGITLAEIYFISINAFFRLNICLNSLHFPVLFTYLF